MFKPKILFLAVASTLLVMVSTQFCHGQLQFPKTPAPGQLIQDYANIVNDEDGRKIAQIQYESYSKFDTPIVVVTIDSKRKFNASREGIEKIAHDLFDHWQIGKRDENDNLINQGILLLVSVGDRKARIELGDDWGRAWDNRCDQIMQGTIVKRFKQSDYSGGILAGVEKLAAMGEKGPDSSPGSSLLENMDEPITEVSPISKSWGLLMIAAGALFIVLGLVVPQLRTQLIVLGVSLILLALFLKVLLWVIIAIIAFMNRGNSSYSGGDWSGGGGFSSGGFSGGGGATGSW